MEGPALDSGGDGPEPGVLGIAATALALLRTRLELLLTEIEEERAWIERAALLAAATGFCLGMAAMLAVGFLVALFWDAYRLAAIGGLAFLFLGAGIVLAAVLVRGARGKPALLSDSLDQLDKDWEQLAARRR
jgi:uncharacterized membrane protein YqjE